MSKHTASFIAAEEKAAPWGKSPLQFEGVGFGMSRFALWKYLHLSLRRVQGQNQNVNKGKICFGFCFSLFLFLSSKVHPNSS